MRWMIAFALAAAAVYGIGKWITKPAFDVETFVETPEIRAQLDKKWENVVNSPRATPHVDINAPESVIRWPAYKSNAVSAPPLELRIKKALWAARNPVSDIAPIGPKGVLLKLDWPESEEQRTQAPAGEEPLSVVYGRSYSSDYPDPIYDPAQREILGIVHVSAADAPREEAEAGLNAAKRLLAAIATPIARK